MHRHAGPLLGRTDVAIETQHRCVGDRVAEHAGADVARDDRHRPRRARRLRHVRAARGRAPRRVGGTGRCGARVGGTGRAVVLLLLVRAVLVV